MNKSKNDFVAGLECCIQLLNKKLDDERLDLSSQKKIDSYDGCKICENEHFENTMQAVIALIEQKKSDALAKKS